MAGSNAAEAGGRRSGGGRAGRGGNDGDAGGAAQLRGRPGMVSDTDSLSSLLLNKRAIQ